VLHSYRFSNFQSFREQAVVSLVLNKQAPARGWEARAKSGARLSTALGILGANGAGKTAALKPLVFVAWFISKSFRSEPNAEIPLTLHFASSNEPSAIELEAEDVDGVLWKYVVLLTRQRVLHEALYRKHERFRYVFIRDWNEQTEQYDIKQQGFGFSAGEARKVRPNASLISTAAQYGVELAQRLASFNLVSNVTFFGRHAFQPLHIRPATRFFASNEDLRKRMVALLTRWDLGLSDVQIREIETTAEDGEPSKTWVTYGLHRTREGETAELLMEQESSGTQSAFVLLSRLLPVLSLGGVAVIDELENDLHPLMVEHVLDLFSNPSFNPHSAQLIFTCHSSEVLDVLQKAQAAFVEKVDCESTIYRGDEIQGLRSDDNLRAKYMAGALGAVPQI
jgi:hypothetical protein